jgi:hypothetical protein
MVFTPPFPSPARGGQGGVKQKTPTDKCRGSEYYSKSTGYAITIPERSLYATTNIYLLTDSLVHKFAGEYLYKQIFFARSSFY